MRCTPWGPAAETDGTTLPSMTAADTTTIACRMTDLRRFTGASLV